MTLFAGLPDALTWAMLVGVPAAAIFGLGFRLMSDRKAWAVAYLGAVVAICGVVMAPFLALYLLLTPLLGLYAAYAAGFPMMFLVVRGSRGKSLVDRLSDPLIKPIWNRYYAAVWPNEYNPDGSRKDGR